MKYAFARKFDLSAKPRGIGGDIASGAGGEGDYGNPSCVWDQSSTAMKALMIGGGLVALGSVAFAFLGPAKLMTTYLIASAVGATTGLGTYYYRASKAECGDGLSEDWEAECQAHLANMSEAHKAGFQLLKSASDAAVESGAKTVFLEGKTYTIEQAFKAFASKLEASKDPHAAKFANCIRKELESEGS